MRKKLFFFIFLCLSFHANLFASSMVCESIFGSTLAHVEVPAMRSVYADLRKAVDSNSDISTIPEISSTASWMREQLGLVLPQAEDAQLLEDVEGLQQSLAARFKYGAFIKMSLHFSLLIEKLDSHFTRMKEKGFDVVDLYIKTDRAYKARELDREFLFLPTHKPLSHRDIMEMIGEGLNPIWIVEKPTRVDGVSFSPSGVARHDIEHAHDLIIHMNRSGLTGAGAISITQKFKKLNRKIIPAIDAIKKLELKNANVLANELYYLWFLANHEATGLYVTEESLPDLTLYSLSIERKLRAEPDSFFKSIGASKGDWSKLTWENALANLKTLGK